MAKIIERVDDKSRVGVCIDTCTCNRSLPNCLSLSDTMAGHAFAAVCFVEQALDYHMTTPYRDTISEQRKAGSKFIPRMYPIDFIDHPFFIGAQV